MSSVGRSLVSAAVLAVGTASGGVVPAAPPPGVNDEAKFFSPEAVETANQKIQRIYADYGKTSVRFETVPAVPAELQAALKEMGPERFFPFWAAKRMRDAKLGGIYILLCRQPGQLQVEVDKLTRKKAFTQADLDQLVAVMSAQLRQRNYDAALGEGLEFVESALQNNLGKPKAPKKKR